MSSTVYKAIKAAHELPSPTGVALRILELAQSEASTVDEIADAVKSDPAIAGRLLKLVNTPLAGMPRQIASLPRAVALLGVRTVTNLALGFSLVSNHRKGKCAAFDYELFWSESVARAVSARHVAYHLRSFSPDEAFTVGLLCQIGRLALAAAFPQQDTSVLQATTSDDPDALCEGEKALFGIDHHELAAEMMADWHMPAVFCEAVRVQAMPDVGGLDLHSRVCQFARILHLTTPIALILTRPTVYRDTLSALAEKANCLGISPYLCHEMLDAVSHEWCDAGRILSVRTRSVPSLAEIYSLARERRHMLAEEPGASAWNPVGETEGASR